MSLSVNRHLSLSTKALSFERAGLLAGQLVVLTSWVAAVIAD